MHSKFSPSQLPRIIRCPGSVKATEHLNKQSSSYAEEGTMLHEVTEACLRNEEYKVPATIIAQNGLDSSHVEAVQEVLDWVVAKKLEYTGEETKEFIETEVSLEPLVTRLHCEHLEDVYGTLDYCLFVPALTTLYVVDWKYGKGVEVWPDSEQLKAYGLGALCKFPDNKIDKVVLVIGQPRLYAGELFKIYETSKTELFSWAKEELVPALNNALSSQPKFCPTDKGCMWCEIRSTCKYRKDQAMQSAADVFKIHAKLPDKTDEDEVAEFLHKLPDLKKYIADIELYAMNIIKNGKQLPGWKLVPGRSIRKWKDEKQAMKYYIESDLYDFEDLTITKFKSPTQIEKLVGKKNITEEELELVIKPEGKPTLVPESDRRDPIEYQSVTDKFSEYADN